MTVWKPESVESEPVTKTTRWKVISVQSNLWKESSDHVVCWCGEGRVSSPIIDWDPKSRIATTRSGRKYHLVEDGFGLNQDAIYVFSRWKNINQITSEKDVSEKYQ